MALQYSTAHRTNNVTDIVTALGATGYLLVYTGTVPATCAKAATGTLLASLPLSATAGTVTTGVLTFNAITSAAAAAAGTAGYFRLATSAAGTPNARGQGVGRAVMQELERIARDAGFQRVRLDSNAELAAAQVLYRRLGYQAVPRFNDDPYPTHFYAREL